MIMGWTVKENVGEAKEVAGEKAKENAKILKELDKPLNAKDLKKIGSVNDISKNQLTELDKPLNAKDLKKIGSANDVPKNQLSALDRPLNAKNDIKRCEDRKTEKNINESDNASEAKDKSETKQESKDVNEVAQVVQNKLDGCRRENEVEDELRKKYPESEGYQIVKEAYLRDENGNFVIDPETGEKRRIDFVVVKDGKVVKSIEVTSMNAPKDDQIAKENRIRENNGNYIRDNNGNLVEIPADVKTDIERRK